ncbi:hypothetical protein B0H11DRAFT_2281632 [Mycena galericulata]|nr:hypothetical protein B0H11DRAFT_2281632 [Mycena galericulata]
MSKPASTARIQWLRSKGSLAVSRRNHKRSATLGLLAFIYEKLVRVPVDLLLPPPVLTYLSISISHSFSPASPTHPPPPASTSSHLLRTSCRRPLHPTPRTPPRPSASSPNGEIPAPPDPHPPRRHHPASRFARDLAFFPKARPPPPFTPLVSDTPHRRTPAAGTGIVLPRVAYENPAHALRAMFGKAGRRSGWCLRVQDSTLTCRFAGTKSDQTGLVQDLISIIVRSLVFAVQDDANTVRHFLMECHKISVGRVTHQLDAISRSLSTVQQASELDCVCSESLGSAGGLSGQPSPSCTHAYPSGTHIWLRPSFIRAGPVIESFSACLLCVLPVIRWCGTGGVAE